MATSLATYPQRKTQMTVLEMEDIAKGKSDLIRFFWCSANHGLLGEEATAPHYPNSISVLLASK